ncbi:putative DNA transformation protein TfoX [Vibrio nigripulchritudo SOn1]|uniref:DNA transformation protein TfoX n=1 Tax=Vibrio nigripulchritudo SOn1 TaxID=1238450 RepID=A0AAV2VHN0_9VIBR|nr:TfoX/Sxy family DNA transformation protein [Vibrio nigripulchritudo]CCO44204.1 putative DNA transformation protein TfoX [Vibrio nigripulchritudo SOn1]
MRVSNSEAQSILNRFDMPNKEMISMFGGMTFFSEQTPFACYAKGSLYLRASDKMKKKLDSSGVEPMTYLKKSSNGQHVVKTRYYPIPRDILENENSLLRAAKQACREAKEEKALQARTEVRIKDLPNMQLNTERMLKRVGIHTTSQLREIGAQEAFSKLQCLYEELSSELYFKIEGAIVGKHYLIVKKQSLAA